jgi:hypothetical protein
MGCTYGDVHIESPDRDTPAGSTARATFVLPRIMISSS